MSIWGTEAASRHGVRALSLLGFIAVWAVASAISGDSDVLPSPATVAGLIAKEAADGKLFFHIGMTLYRVVSAFVLAMAIGITLGLFMGTVRKADSWLDMWLVVFLNLPALVVIVLAYIWVGLNEVAAIAAVTVNKVPMVTAMIREGARALDPQLRAMGHVFRMSPTARLRHIILPQLAPHIAAAARAGVALIWKIVLVVELLGRPNGVGFQIHLHFQNFDVGRVLAYALSFVVVMLLVEALILQPVERRASRWRHV